ncbi:DUF7009 family protein [Dyadobacter tibetensis]|uniref:DUF7009 family protein n=1 Tax=Dyadobacter tibetensis TaxID=1211851 RepID=UPI00046F3CF5|nr:hypothetical protein [Dyadobacter tibetensis]
MKLRILNDSLRIRLSKSEVTTLARSGVVESQTEFVGGILYYSLEIQEQHGELEATFSGNRIKVLVPKAFAETWPENDVVGMSSKQQIRPDGTLKLLLEKDFKCLDNTTEDQSDHYENPNSIC